jgi:hypothetical protein
MAYDSTPDTQAHIARVRHFIGQIVKNLWGRADAHDASKLVSPEKEVFDRVTPKLRGLTYGSPEYHASLAEMGEALRHHYQHNSHHPEHFGIWACPLCGKGFEFATLKASTCFKTIEGGAIYFCPECCAHGTIMEAILEPGHGILGMSLFDLLEMLADWKAATERHADGNMATSLEKNIQRFHIGPELAQILKNTLKETGW